MPVREKKSRSGEEAAVVMACKHQKLKATLAKTRRPLDPI